jgi:hypothetical protein
MLYRCLPVVMWLPCSIIMTLSYKCLPLVIWLVCSIIMTIPYHIHSAESREDPGALTTWNPKSHSRLLPLPLIIMTMLCRCLPWVMWLACSISMTVLYRCRYGYSHFQYACQGFSSDLVHFVACKNMNVFEDINKEWKSVTLIRNERKCDNYTPVSQFEMATRYQAVMSSASLDYCLFEQYTPVLFFYTGVGVP